MAVPVAGLLAITRHDHIPEAGWAEHGLHFAACLLHHAANFLESLPPPKLHSCHSLDMTPLGYPQDNPRIPPGYPEDTPRSSLAKLSLQAYTSLS